MRTSIAVVMLLVALVLAACSPSESTETTTTAADTPGQTVDDEPSAGESTTTTTGSSAPTTTQPGSGGGDDGSQSTTTTTAPPASSTTTTVPQTTTTTIDSATTTTTEPAQGENRPPTVTITAPANLSSFPASFDPSRFDFGALVAFSAVADDPDGDEVTVTWSVSNLGVVGEGPEVTVWLSTFGSDTAQPVITAVARDPSGATASDSVQVIVWIPSDT